MNKFELEVKQRGYIIGKEVLFYILIGKIHDTEYVVKVLEHHKEIVSVIIYEKLSLAKRKGVELLLGYNPNVPLEEVEMIHFKEDRPNGKTWQKDSEKVLEELLKQNNKNEECSIVKDMMKMVKDKNTILYGPPGTGKTYTVAEKALEIIMPQQYKKIMGTVRL